MGDPQERELSENHRRAISTTLAMLDEMLCGFERWAGGQEMHAVLYNEHNALTPEQSGAIVQEIGNIRGLLRQMQADLHLGGPVVDVAHAIWGYAAGLWPTLVETESQHLRGYGQPPEWLAGYLDPRIEELIEKLSRIGSIALGTGGRAGRAQDPEPSPRHPGAGP
jgi:hypothetical protein